MDGGLWKMSIFVRSIASFILVMGLSFVAGCESTKSGDKTMNLFSFPKAEKEPDKAGPSSVGEFIGRDRATTLRR